MCQEYQENEVCEACPVCCMYHVHQVFQVYEVCQVFQVCQVYEVFQVCQVCQSYLYGAPRPHHVGFQLGPPGVQVPPLLSKGLHPLRESLAAPERG